MELLSATFKAGQPEIIQVLQLHCSHTASLPETEKVGDHLGKSCRLLKMIQLLRAIYIEKTTTIIIIHFIFSLK